MTIVSAVFISKDYISLLWLQILLLGCAPLRCVTTLDTPPSPDLHRNRRFGRFDFNKEQSKPYYQAVCDGKEDQRKGTPSDVADELSSEPAMEFIAEELYLYGPSKDINHAVTPINDEEGELNDQMSIESTKRKENDTDLVTDVPTQCEDEGDNTVVVLRTATAGNKPLNHIIDSIPFGHRRVYYDHIKLFIIEFIYYSLCSSKHNS